MLRTVCILMMMILVVSCLAVPGDRIKRYHEYGVGYGGVGGGLGYGGHIGHGGHGVGYGGVGVPVASQSFSKSSASSSSVSTGGSFAG